MNKTYEIILKPIHVAVDAPGLKSSWPSSANSECYDQRPKIIICSKLLQVL